MHARLGFSYSVWTGIGRSLLAPGSPRFVFSSFYPDFGVSTFNLAVGVKGPNHNHPYFGSFFSLAAAYYVKASFNSQSSARDCFLVLQDFQDFQAKDLTKNAFFYTNLYLLQVQLTCDHA